MEAAGVLSSAFGLGILLHASQAAFFSAINGHVKTLFLHRRRLVLLAFQLCISLYSIFQFASLLLLADLPCQIAVRFTLFFDQCARAAILGLGVWKVIDESAFKTEKFVWIVVLVLRVFLGAVVVSFTQKTFIPVCFPEPTQMFVGYTAVGFDIALWVLLLLRIVGLWGLFADQGRGGRSEGKSQGYGMFLISLSVLGWSVGSFPYLLKVGESIFVRMIPYILTLGLALGVLALFPSIVFSVPLKCSNGFYSSRMQRLGTRGGSPQPAGPSSSPAFEQNPPQTGDIESNKHTTGFCPRDKGRATRDSNVFGGIIGAPIVHPGANLPWPLDNTAGPDSRQSTLKTYPGGPIGATSVALQENSKRKSLVETLFPAHAGGRAGISGPILRGGGFAEPSSEISTPRETPATTNPFSKVRTVSLRAAKEAERQRIDAQFERDQKKLQEAAAIVGGGVTTPTASKSIPVTPKSGKTVERTTSVKRKPVFPNDTSGLPSGPAPRVSAVVGKRGPQRNKETEAEPEAQPESPSSLRDSVLAAAVDVNWGAMRYSTNTFATMDDDDTTRYTAFSNLPHPLRAPPREAGPGGADESTDGDAKVLFVNEIVYDHPALVNSLVRGPDAREGRKDIGVTTSRSSGTSNRTTIRRSPSSTKRPQLPTTQEADETPSVPSISASVMNRPRHIRKDSGRGIFPPARDSEIVLEMKLKKAVNTSKSLPPPPPPTEPLPPLPVQNKELPVPAIAPTEAPREKKVDKRPTELVFPIPPSRGPSTRKPVPPPVTTEPLGLVSPDVVRRVPSSLLTEPKLRPQEERLSVAPSVPERSESRTVIISPLLKDDIDSATISDAAYETAKAWIASVATVRMSTGAPVLVNVEGGHRVSYPKSSGRDSLAIKPLPAFAYDGDGLDFGSSSVSSLTSSAVLRKSVLSFIASPKDTRGDGDVTDVEIDSGSEIEDDEDNYEGGGDSSSGTETTQSEAGEMIGAGGEGYSTEDDEEDEEYLTESDSQEFFGHRDGVVISGMDDGTEFGKIEMAERKLNAKMHSIANAIPNMSAFPRHFNIGDHIPTFSESRRKYGSKRKPPPSPLGFLMHQRRISRQPPNLQQDRIQARLTMLAENVSRNVAVLDDLLAKIPADAKSNRNTRASLASDGRNSLIAKLEQEMGQQENQWHGMQEVLQRNSSASAQDSRPSSRFSTNLAQRRSLFEKLSSGIDRRLSTAQNSTTTVSRNLSRTTSHTSTLSSSMTAGAWQRQLAEAQIEYLQHAPWKSNNITTTNALVKPSAILKSQDTPVSVVSESEEYGYDSVTDSEDGDYEDDGDEEDSIIVYDGLDIGSPVNDELRRESFCSSNHNTNFLMQHEGKETITISIERASKSSTHRGDEELEEYEAGECLETLPATVYSPGMHSEMSTTCCSPSMKVASPAEGAPVSLLWSPRSISREREQEAGDVSLWSKNRRSAPTPLSRPAAIDVRPFQRVSLEPPTISSAELWKVRSTEPLSPRSEVSVEICLSPSIQELSPNPDQFVPFPRSPLPNFPQIPQTGKLWNYRSLASKPSISSPAAISIRPRQSIFLTPLRVYSTRLWCKPRSHPTYDEGGLWTNRKVFRPESIITPKSPIVASKSKGKSKRVTFVEEVVTVEPTGFFGKLKKLWGVQEMVSVKQIVEVPIAKPMEETEIHAQSVSREQEKPIVNIVQEVTSRNRDRALPGLPTGADQPPRGIKTLWSKGSVEAQRHLAVPIPETRGMWAVPSQKAAPRKNEFKDDISAIRAKPRVPALLPDLTSTQLWGNQDSSGVHVEPNEITNVSVNLWSPAHKVHPPRKAVIPDDLDVLGAESADTSLPVGSSTGLWKPPLDLVSDENSGMEEFTHLWPSANVLVSKDQTNLPRSTKFSPSALAALSSAGLWALPAKVPYKQGLWTAPKKITGLWPQGERLQKSSPSNLWPSASPSSTTGNSVIPSHSSPRLLEAAVVSFKSTGLWKIIAEESTESGLWPVPIGRKGLWPEGETKRPVCIGRLWTATSAQSEIVRRTNIKLVVTSDSGRVMYKRSPVDTTADVTSSMWAPQEGKPAQSSGWLSERQEFEASPTEYAEYITSSPTPNTHSLPELVQESVDIAPIESALWTLIPTIIASQTSSRLWRYQAKTLQSTNRIPRANVNDSDSLRKVRRSIHRILAPAKGPLWKKELAGKSHPQLWAQSSKKDGLWKGKGGTAALTGINALLQNTNSLWTQHGKYVKPVFDDLSLVSFRSKRQLPTRPLELAHGALWVASIPISHGEKKYYNRGLWNSRRGVDQEISEAPPPLTTAQGGESPVSPIRAHKHNLLWQPGGTTQPAAHSPVPPVAPSKSNKRHDDSPLFLALPPATGSVWAAPASKSNPCPPRLWTPSPVTLRGLWSFDKKNPSLAILTRRSNPLWSKHNTPKPIFSTLTTESRRTLPTRPDAIVSMAGPLWTSSPVEIRRPQLWKSLGKTGERLWTAEGTTPLSQIADPKVEKTPLWSRENNTTAPIFSDLSLASLRSKRDISTKTLPVVKEGLWTKRISPPETPRKTVGLWGKFEELPRVEAAPYHVPMLWDKEGIIAPIFSHLPTSSVRSKKDTSSIVLPVFTEPMWKKDVVFRAKPELWKPTPKPTGLWDATSRTKTLAQMTFEKKAKGSPLWRKEGARRTTSATPIRTDTAVRLPDRTALPKVAGGLWKPKIAVKPAPQLWIRRRSMKMEKQAAGVVLWARETALRTTEATPERTKVSFTPSDSPLPRVSGNLWQKKTPEGPKGLWKRPLGTVSSAALPSAPLWSREKASRRTAAVPERLALTPKKTFPVQVDPPKASGTLWKPKANASPDGLWAKPTVITTKPIAIRTVLWTAASASRTTSAAPARSTIPKRVIEDPLPIVSGKMWQKGSPEKSKGLWKRETKTVGTSRKTANAPLWTKEGAARTTAAIPERTPFVAKPTSKKPLPPAIGDLWQPELAEKEAITLWKQKPAVPKVGVWNAEGTTPSLAEIKRELASKYTLWQRRSVLAARGANGDIFSNRSSFIQRKLTMDPIHLDTTQSHLWKPMEGSGDDDDTSWMITSTPPTGTLSHTSTLSDISEISPPTSAVDAYEPRIRTHSNNPSISSTSGLWRPLSNSSSSKKAGLWSNDETSAPFVDLISDIRAERIPLPAQREKPLETFDRSHNLWQPEILCDSKTIRSNSDASEYCTGGSVSEFSDDSFYSAMGAHSEHGGEENAPSSVFVGQFRRDNYMIHGQAPEQKLAEDSPFASHLRIPSLRRKLRSAEERKVRITGVSEGQISEAETTEKVVAPSAGYLWSKGIV